METLNPKYRDYVELYDINTIEYKVGKPFGCSSRAMGTLASETNQTQYKQDWDDTINKINELIIYRDYDLARKRLDAFYENYKEEHDWYYLYHITRILCYEFARTVIKPLYEIDNRETKLRSEHQSSLRRLQKAIQYVADSVEQEEQNKELATLVAFGEDIEELLNQLFEEHKFWSEVDELTNDERVVTDSKVSDFKKALLLVGDNVKGVAYVYSRLSLYAMSRFCENETEDFYPLYSDIIQCAKDIKRKKENQESLLWFHQDQINASLRTIKECFFQYDLNTFMESDGSISEHNRRLLDERRALLGLSEKAAVKIERRLIENKQKMHAVRKYVDALQEAMVGGGVSKDDRASLDKLRESLGLSKKYVTDIEKKVKAEQEYIRAVKDAMMDGDLSNRRRRKLGLDQLRRSLHITEERAQELEKSIS